MTLEEIKIRRLSNQHLLEKDDCMTVLRDLCGVQAQFISNAMHALRIRCVDFETMDASMLIKSWTLRGTMHIFAHDDLPVFLHKNRTHYLRPCDTLEADEYINRERKAYFANLIVNLVRSGLSTREELKVICAQNGMTQIEAQSIFNPWGGTIRALCENGTLCHIVQEKKAFQLCPNFEPMEKDTAELELARRYFTNFGPATVRDAAYFFGCTQARVKKWLALLPVQKAECDGKTYFYIESGRECPAKMPDCIFLAGFDQLLLGYRKEDNPFLPPEHLRGIFNLAGIVNPTVLLHGRIVGKWKLKGDMLTVRLFEDISPNDTKLIQDCAKRTWAKLKLVDIKKEN